MFWTTSDKSSIRDYLVLRLRSQVVRFTFIYVVSAFLILWTAAASFYFGLARSLTREQDEFLVNKVQTLRELLKSRPTDLAALKEEVEEDWAPRQYAPVCARILTRDGRVITESPHMDTRLAMSDFAMPAFDSAASDAAHDAPSLPRPSSNVCSSSLAMNARPSSLRNACVATMA